MQSVLAAVLLTMLHLPVTLSTCRATQHLPTMHSRNTESQTPLTFVLPQRISSMPHRCGKAVLGPKQTAIRALTAEATFTTAVLASLVCLHLHRTASVAGTTASLIKATPRHGEHKQKAFT